MTTSNVNFLIKNSKFKSVQINKLLQGFRTMCVGGGWAEAHSTEKTVSGRQMQTAGKL